MEIQERILGGMLGLICGDAIGSKVLGLPVAWIKSRFTDPYDGKLKVDMDRCGGNGLLVAQPTGNTELAFALAESLTEKGYSKTSAKRTYLEWLSTEPKHASDEVLQALAMNEPTDINSNDPLPRSAVIGMVRAGMDDISTAKTAMNDCSLTHSSRLTKECSAALAVLFSRVTAGGYILESVHDTVDFCKKNGYLDGVCKAVAMGQYLIPPDFINNQKNPLTALRATVWALMNTVTPEEAARKIIVQGGDTRTNGSLACAILGASGGIEGFEADWIEKVESCQPIEDIVGVRFPRPEWLWPSRYRELAEKINETNIAIGPRQQRTRIDFSMRVLFISTLKC